MSTTPDDRAQRTMPDREERASEALEAWMRAQRGPTGPFGLLGPFGCRCQTLRDRLVGDGCDMCNPERAQNTEEEG